jgi:hypothetical protein
MKTFFKGVSCALAVMSTFTARPAGLIAETPEPPAAGKGLEMRESGSDALKSIAGIEPGYSSCYGPILGVGVTMEEPGSQPLPYRYQLKLSGGAAPFVDFRYQLQFRGDFRTILPNTALFVEASTSGLDRMHFYGFGNDRYYRGTGWTEDDFEITARITTLRASLRYPIQKQYFWTAGIASKWVDLDIRPGSFAYVHRSEIPGIDDTFSGSFFVGFHYDSTENSRTAGLFPGINDRRHSSGETFGSNTAVSGTLVDVEAAHYPGIFGNDRSFSKLRGEIRTYIPVSADVFSRLALRIAGEKIWGDYPFLEAAYLGGATTLRGYDRQRFAGDGSLYAGSELRIHAGQFNVYVPVIWGPLAFIESGRVFLEGEDSSAWHTGAGCGLWFGIDNSRYTATIAYGRGFDDGRLMDDVGLYARAGFSF